MKAIDWSDIPTEEWIEIREVFPTTMFGVQVVLEGKVAIPSLFDSSNILQDLYSYRPLGVQGQQGVKGQAAAKGIAYEDLLSLYESLPSK